MSVFISYSAQIVSIFYPQSPQPHLLVAAETPPCF